MVIVSITSLFVRISKDFFLNLVYNFDKFIVLKIGETISDSIDSNLDEIAKYGRERGPNKRLVGAKNEIGIHSIRGGDIVGDHTVLYAGPGERIELKHQAHSRECFTNGAIKAIKFIVKAEDNRIYSTSEVLGL